MGETDVRPKKSSRGPRRQNKRPWVVEKAEKNSNINYENFNSKIEIRIWGSIEHFIGERLCITKIDWWFEQKHRFIVTADQDRRRSPHSRTVGKLTNEITSQTKRHKSKNSRAAECWQNRLYFVSICHLYGQVPGDKSPIFQVSLAAKNGKHPGPKQKWDLS